jgi:type VI secretion system protein ImpH
VAPKKRQSDIGIETKLYDEFYEFSFFKAVELLEKFATDKKRLGKTLEPEKEPVRFLVKPGFVFPASDISGLRESTDKGPAEMEVAFMGLIGPSGLLPNWYNELAIEREKNKDHTFVEFLNIFHHRLISLFYLAWKKPRFPENYRPGAGDRLSRYVISLAGLGTSGMVGMLGLPRESLTFYSGLLSLPMASAASIEAAIEYFSGSQTTVDQFVQRDVSLEEDDFTSLGTANATLGSDAICGTTVKECQTKFRVNLGPMGYQKYMRLMPVGDLLLPVFSLIRYMVGIEFEFEIRVFLKKNEVPMCVLGEEGPGKTFLGWTTWMSTSGYNFQENQYITFQEVDLQQLKISTQK